MIYIIALSVIAGALGIYYFLFKNLNYFTKHDIPCIPLIPSLGTVSLLLFRRKSAAEFVKELYNLHPKAKYTGIFGITTPGIIIRDIELVKSITIKYFDIFPNHYTFMDETQDILGKNLFALRGDKWRQIRDLLSPTFTSSKMKSMFKLMSNCGAEFADHLAQLSPEQRIMDLKDIFTRYSNDVIATCVFGVHVDSIRNPKNEFYMYGKEVSTFSITNMIKLMVTTRLPWFARLINLKVIRQKVIDFFRDLIETTINTRDKNGIVRPDMLQLMMENRGKEGKPELSLNDMVAQAFIFFLGGIDNTSTSMCFAAHEIAVNQNVQEKLQKEIDQVLEETNGQVSYEAINSMEYLDAVINETLRMYPVALATDRLCVKDFELPPALPGLKSVPIKEGQAILIPIYGFLHDPKYFKEPEKFDPERFCGERKKDILNSGAYFPFGLGPRICIGNRFALLQIKALFFHLLARCDLKICEKTSVPLKIAKGFFMKAEGDFWLKVLSRKDAHHTLAANLAVYSAGLDEISKSTQEIILHLVLYSCNLEYLFLVSLIF